MPGLLYTSSQKNKAVSIVNQMKGYSPKYDSQGNFFYYEFDEPDSIRDSKWYEVVAELINKLIEFNDINNSVAIGVDKGVHLSFGGSDLDKFKNATFSVSQFNQPSR